MARGRKAAVPVMRRVPVVSGLARSGNKRRGAHKHKVVRCFIMALQSLWRKTTLHFTTKHTLHTLHTSAFTEYNK